MPPDPFALARLGHELDSKGDYDGAWAAWTASKQAALALGGMDYQDAAVEQLFSRLEIYPFNDLPKVKIPDVRPQPIFIVGFPRSGTTLVEQILTQHPLIKAGDELPYMHEMTATMAHVLNSPYNYPEALIEPNAVLRLKGIYMERARAAGLTKDCRWFTDKMPLNETHLGLISAMFPKSPIIHVRRNPLDVMVSAFSYHFQHGFGCAATLPSLALHYARMNDLVWRYRDTLSLHYQTIDYESLLINLEIQVRKLLTFIGVEFDIACLSPQNNPRVSRSLSAEQVKQAPHTGSMGRYTLYSKHLEQVRKILGYE